MGNTTKPKSQRQEPPSEAPMSHPVFAAYSPDSPSLTRGTPTQNVWCGEWTYIIKNQVHSFDITVEKGKLVYTENMGASIIRGKVVLNGENSHARIIVKSMKFEIDINRLDMMARYRAIGSKKWTKTIPLMKVDEIEDSVSGVSLSWNKSTLRNTWKNTAVPDYNAVTPEASFVPRDRSMRGCSIRKMASMRNYTVDRQQSTKSEDVADLFEQNSLRRSIRFAPDVKDELLKELACEDDEN